MSALFDLPLVPGLRTRDAIVSEEEEAGLIAAIEGAGLTPFQFGQYEGKRLTRSFGAHYDFGRHRLVEAEPLPSWLQDVRARAAAFAGVQAEEFAHALLIRYDPGAGIGWHRDRPAFDQVVGISLGSAVELAFRRRRPDGGFDRRRLPLAPRSAYLLSGEARWAWEHGIAAHPALRYSITFRTIAPPRGQKR